MSNLKKAAAGWKSLVLAMLASLALFVAPASALTPEEEAAVAIGQQWVKAVLSRDGAALVKLMPATMFPKEGDRERATKMRLHDSEVAVIRKQKVTTFTLAPPIQSLKVGSATAVVIPYQSVVQSPEGRLQVDSSLIAVTLDGRNWSAFDGSGQSLKSLKTIIPGYGGGLNIPAVKSVLVKPE